METPLGERFRLAHGVRAQGSPDTLAVWQAKGAN
jgi:hypothetical protein